MKYTAKHTESAARSLAEQNDNRFNQRLSNYQALIGQPHWQSSGYGASHQIQHYVAHGNKLRSYAIRRTVRTFLNASRKGIVRIWNTVTAYRRQQLARQELSALNDRALRDIGLTRSDIFAVSANAAHAEVLNAHRTALRPPVSAPTMTQETQRPKLVECSSNRTQIGSEKILDHAA